MQIPLRAVAPVTGEGRVVAGLMAPLGAEVSACSPLVAWNVRGGEACALQEESAQALALLEEARKVAGRMAQRCQSVIRATSSGSNKNLNDYKLTPLGLRIVRTQYGSWKAPSWRPFRVSGREALAVGTPGECEACDGVTSVNLAHQS